jgi:hypothetical protein
VRKHISAALIAGLFTLTAHAQQTAAELDKRERCAVRLSIALTGKTPTTDLLQSVDPQAQADALLDTTDFIERFARFTNTAFNRSPGATSEEDAPYYVAWEVLSKRKPWRDLFIGQYRVEKNAADAVVVVNDPNGLGYMRSPAWLKRYAGNEPNGVKLSTAYRIFNNVIGLKMTPSTNSPDSDITATGRQASGCRACHYDGMFALDVASSVLTTRVGDGATMTFKAPTITAPVTMLGGIEVSNDKELVTALTNSESFNFRTCRMAFEFLYGRRENRCEGPVFDRCMKEFRTQGTLQSAVATVVKDNSFCQ